MHYEPVRLLLADDDKDDCFLFREAVEELSLSTQLSIVYDGQQLMDMLYQENLPLPDLLFLDLNMPRKNGFECLAEIKQHKRLRHIPVVIYSTSSQIDIINLLYKNGAQYYLQKPNEFALLRSAILRVLIMLMENNFTQPPQETFVLLPLSVMP